MATAVRSLASVSPARTPGPIEDLLRQVLEGQRALEAKLDAVLARDRRPERIAREDEERFVSVVAMAVKGRAFSAAELLAHGIVDAELRQALGNLTARQVGKRLRTLSDRDVGGFTVKAVKRDGAGTIWAVYVSAHLHADAGFNADRGV